MQRSVECRFEKKELVQRLRTSASGNIQCSDQVLRVMQCQTSCSDKFEVDLNDAEL